MKVVILAGGYGTRISEESDNRPKPMLNIGGMPILWHIMKGFSEHGYNDFIICAGYKQEVIKTWFADYMLTKSDVTFDFSNSGSIEIHEKHFESWKVTVVDTGVNTQTGGRVKRIQNYVQEENFILTYGDAVSDVNITELVNFHNNHSKKATLTVYKYAQSKGVLQLEENDVTAFREKSLADAEVINIGYMVLHKTFFDSILSDSTILEKEPMDALVKANELKAYPHSGFWQCMDTLKEKRYLEKLWTTKNAKWKIW